VALQVRPLATTAVVNVVLNVSRGTPPISVQGKVTIYDLYADELASRSFTDTISTSPPVQRTYQLSFDVSRWPPGTYIAVATVILSNQAGQKEMRDSAQFTIPSQPYCPEPYCYWDPVLQRCECIYI